MSSLEQAILKTIIYFDIFDYPLTKDELWSWLYGYEEKKVFSKAEFENVLTGFDGALRQYLDQRNEFYFLKKREELLELREVKREISLRKLRKARLIAKLLSLVPWVKAIVLSGDVAYLNAPEDADFDYFIITENGHIWATRFWCASLMKILGLRPDLKQGKLANKACLSFFVSEDHLNLEHVLLKDKSGRSDDPHFAYWFAQFLFLYVEDNLAPKLYQENQWLKRYLSNWQMTDTESSGVQPLLMIFKKIFRLTTLPLEENIYRNFQMKILNEKLRAAAGKGNVILNDHILKLHQNDRRAYCRETFYQRLRQLNLT